MSLTLTYCTFSNMCIDGIVLGRKGDEGKKEEALRKRVMKEEREEEGGMKKKGDRRKRGGMCRESERGRKVYGKGT